MTRACVPLLIGVGLALAGCGTLWTDQARDAKDPGSVASVPPRLAEDMARVTYDCAGGLSFGTTFNNSAGTAIVELKGQQPITLYIAATGSGFSYMDGGRELRGKGDEAIWTDKGKSAVKCKARAG